jgi:hypothetical protein
VLCLTQLRADLDCEFKCDTSLHEKPIQIRVGDPLPIGGRRARDRLPPLLPRKLDQRPILRVLCMCVCVCAPVGVYVRACLCVRVRVRES